MATKYFNALIQIVLNNQLNLFDSKLPNRKELFKKVFENEQFIPAGQIDKDVTWGIGETRYIDEDEEWIFGFLHKAIDGSGISTLPSNAHSLKEISDLPGQVVIKTPFFFNFETQRIYTQSNWRISRVSKSASFIWRKILTYLLKEEINDLDVQSIPEKASFYEKLDELKIINIAEFDLFGPNNLNDQRIRSIISEFSSTETNGIIVTLKNYLKGLRRDSNDFKVLIKYMLRGGGKGLFKGKDSRNEKREVNTESQHEKIIVSEKLYEESTLEDIKLINIEIINKEKNKHEEIKKYEDKE